MIYSQPPDIMIKKKCVFPLFVLEWHLVCLVPAMTSSGTTPSPGSSEQLQQATAYSVIFWLLFPSLCLSPCLGEALFFSPLSACLSLSLCVRLCLHGWVYLCVFLSSHFPCALSQLSLKGKSYSFTFPVLKRTQGLRVS